MGAQLPPPPLRVCFGVPSQLGPSLAPSFPPACALPAARVHNHRHHPAAFGNKCRHVRMRRDARRQRGRLRPVATCHLLRMRFPLLPTPPSLQLLLSAPARKPVQRQLGAPQHDHHRCARVGSASQYHPSRCSAGISVARPLMSTGACSAPPALPCPGCACRRGECGLHVCRHPAHRPRRAARAADPRRHPDAADGAGAGHYHGAGLPGRLHRPGLGHRAGRAGEPAAAPRSSGGCSGCIACLPGGAPGRRPPPPRLAPPACRRSSSACLWPGLHTAGA